MLLGILAAGPKASGQLARMANAYQPIQKSLDAGDCENGVLLLGQATGIISDTPTVAELIARIIAEAEAANARVQEKLAGQPHA
jgi:NAD(P)H-dependent flavin oxidoreductase YrpB (nitropropane dioxygenase family)